MQLLGNISTCGATAGVFAQPRPTAAISTRDADPHFWGSSASCASVAHLAAASHAVWLLDRIWFFPFRLAHPCKQYIATTATLLRAGVSHFSRGRKNRGAEPGTGCSPDCLKMKNSEAPAGKREALDLSNCGLAREGTVGQAGHRLAAISFIVLPLPPRRAAVAGSRAYRKWRGAAPLRGQ